MENFEERGLNESKYLRIPKSDLKANIKYVSVHTMDDLIRNNVDLENLLQGID